MVEEKKPIPRCGECSEVCGSVWQGYVFCAYLNQDVWAQSIKCQHGLDLDDAF